jgi:hypothetical protein
VGGRVGGGVGRLVGRRVGGEVGRLVGGLVGFLVGSGVGFRVGFLVGNGVGFRGGGGSYALTPVGVAVVSAISIGVGELVVGACMAKTGISSQIGKQSPERRRELKTTNRLCS